MGNNTNRINHQHTLIASIAYSTWNNLPSGEKVFTPLSYSLLISMSIKVDKGSRGLFGYDINDFFSSKIISFMALYDECLSSSTIQGIDYPSSGHAMSN